MPPLRLAMDWSARSWRSTPSTVTAFSSGLDPVAAAAGAAATSASPTAAKPATRPRRDGGDMYPPAVAAPPPPERLMRPQPSRGRIDVNPYWRLSVSILLRTDFRSLCL